MTSSTTPSMDAAQRREALVEKLFGAAIGTMETATVYLGDRLGLYQALQDSGTATSGELAVRTGTAERYIREWLEQQAVAGILDVEDAGAGATERRYLIPEGHAEVLLDADSLHHFAPISRFTVGITGGMRELVEAFR